MHAKKTRCHVFNAEVLDDQVKKKCLCLVSDVNLPTNICCRIIELGPRQDLQRNRSQSLHFVRKVHRSKIEGSNQIIEAIY